MRFFRIDNCGAKMLWAYYKIKTDSIAISLCLTVLYHVSILPWPHFWSTVLHSQRNSDFWLWKSNFGDYLLFHAQVTAYGIYFFGKNQLLVGSKSEVMLVSMLILHICRAHVEYLYVLSQHCAFHSVLV